MFLDCIFVLVPTKYLLKQYTFLKSVYLLSKLQSVPHLFGFLDELRRFPLSIWYKFRRFPLSIWYKTYSLHIFIFYDCNGGNLSKHHSRMGIGQNMSKS